MIMTIMTMLCNTVSTLDYQKSSSRALINQYNVTVVVLYCSFNVHLGRSLFFVSVTCVSYKILLGSNTCPEQLK